MKCKPLILLSCLAMSSGALGGCTAAHMLDEAAGNFFLQGDVNLKEKNYIAADYLAGLTRETIDRRTVIVPQTLMHANNTGMTSTFGEVVVEQVGARFAQLGYIVHMPANEGEERVPLSPTKGVSLGGTYLPNDSSADISLRLVDRSTGQVLGAYDYTIPVNSEVGDLMEPQPRIFRVPQ